MDNTKSGFASASDFISRSGTDAALAAANTAANTAAPGQTKLTGFVERVVFSNEDNGFTICEVSTEGDEGQQVLVTLVGTMPFIAEGETVTAHGSWTVHPNFGRQFAVES